MATSILVLVVEDNFLIQTLVLETLTDGGYGVEVASTGEEAIAKLDAIGAEFCALMTDVSLAPRKLTGWDVARYAREIISELPVVYMTGGNAVDWASKGVPKSVLLTKPFVPAQVVAAVSQLLKANIVKLN